MKILHIVNPVRVGPKSDLNVAQPITFASMRAARDFARLQGIQVELQCVHYEEDDGVAGDGFQQLPHLTRSILDVGTFREKRKLPLLADIFSAAYETRDADYVVYTNVDIGVMPSFYTSVASLIEGGNEAIVINRRTMPSEFRSPADLPLIYARLGEPHPGFDCFVIRRDLLPRFDIGQACIGMAAIGRIVLLNIIVHARPWVVLKGAHLTFHIGEDQAWRDDRFTDYTQHNNNEFRRIMKKYQAEGRKPDNGELATIMKRIRQDPDQSPGSGKLSPDKLTLKQRLQRRG